MADTLPADLLDRLVVEGNKALNDHYHDELCACTSWPERCASRGGYFFGCWDTNAFAIAMPTIYQAIREQVACEIEDGIPTWEGMGERARDRNEMLHLAARIARNGGAK